MRNFENDEYNGVYAPQSRGPQMDWQITERDDWILINNRPIYQNVIIDTESENDFPVESSFGDKCIWWDKSPRRWLLGLCEDLGTDKA